MLRGPTAFRDDNLAESNPTTALMTNRTPAAQSHMREEPQ